MRGFLLIVCLGVGACDDAVVLEVHTAPNVPTDTVQLFIGLGECGECPGIQPPDAPAILPGVVFYREDSYRDTAVRTARVENGVARFRIEPSEVGNTFTLAVAVDASGQSAAVIRSLPLDQAGRYRVDLVEANTNGSGLGPKPATANGNFVGIWQQPNGTLPCMGFEQWTNGRLDGRAFIVPGDDLDCDARRDQECAPYGYDAVGLPTFEDATCVTETPVTLDTNLCSLGGPACDEVSGQSHTCYPTDYCVPSSLCDLSNTPCSNPAVLAGCLFGTVVAPKSKLKCTIPFQPESDGLHAHLCTTNFEFDLSTVSPTAALLSCAGPSGNQLLPAPPNTTPTMLAFQDALQFTSEDEMGTTYALDFKLRGGSGTCTYKVDLNGEKALEVMSPEGKPPYAQFWVSRSGGALRKLLVPVEIQYLNDCSREASCVLITEPGDSIATCLR